MVGVTLAASIQHMLTRRSCRGWGSLRSAIQKKGDIAVLSSNSRHPYGHIAVYDGKRWISDYKQRRVYPNTVYEKESTVKYFRQTDGWHTANIWVSPIDLWEYIQVLCNNYRKIKLL